MQSQRKTIRCAGKYNLHMNCIFRRCGLRTCCFFKKGRVEKMNRFGEEDFMLINLRGTQGKREFGLLKTIGERDIVVSTKLLSGADEADNVWLMQKVKEAYMQYYCRVQEYNKEVQ
jgi:hypothetical protein